MATILVVDDEDCIRKVLRQFLTGKGHEVLEAADGLEALAVLEKYTVDLAVVDLMMPHMNGLEVLQQMQQDFPDTKAMAISAVGQILDPAERELNVVRTLKKPLELKELGDTLQQALA